MTRRHFALVSAFLLFAPAWLVRADDKSAVDAIISAGRSNNRAMEHLDFLCNRFGPRLTSSDNLYNAEVWARDTFESFGLKDARLEEWGEFAVGFNRGPWSGRMVKPTEKSLAFGTMAWSAGTKGVQRGRAVLPPLTEDDFETTAGQLKGAWVLTRRPDSQPPGELKKKFDAAVREAHVAGVVNSVGGELIITDGRPPRTWDALPTTPSINMTKKDYTEVAELVAKGEEVILEFDIRNYFKKGPIKNYNVIADIPGTEFPDEYVIVGGHIDSWDGATGAMDNGTGSAATIEAARILMAAGVKPRRTIRFMLWSGEEQGLLGSQGYIRKHRDLLEKISAVLVDDGGTNYLSGIAATEAMMPDFEKIFEPVASLNPEMPFKLRKVSGLPLGIGSDHDSFLGAGVPGFYWNQSGRAKYNHIHHTQHDTFDGAIPEYQEHSSIVIALGAYGIANLDHKLSRENLRRAPTAAGTPRNNNRRVMGVQLDELEVQMVLPDSLAEKAGIKEGDVFVKLDGKKVEGQQELTDGLQQGEPKKKVTVVRDGKEIDFTLEWPK